ncbi:MAG TPA: hypothetical protein VGA20_07120 [Gemmatimonadales bacterium]
MAERLGILLEIFSPWEGIALTYRQFAAELGKPVTEAAVKKWPRRKTFPADAARLIVTRARERGLIGVTLEWVMWGEGPRPLKSPKTTPRPVTEWRGPGSEPPRELHGQLAARIAEALGADLSHNESGQWSSVEVQHTVIWALKDLARRLRVLQFEMGQSFELTDEWAATIGLPVRPKALRPTAERPPPKP